MKQVAYSRSVEVKYKLADADAIITLNIETNGVALPDSAVRSLSGDVCRLIEAGDDTKTIVWNAGIDWPENATESAVACVTAWSMSAPPQYAAIEVVGGYSAPSYPISYYPSADGVPGGVTNDQYKTGKILLRRIEPTDSEGFYMGSPTNEVGRSHDREAQVQVKITRAFYMGIYEVTQQQWQFIMGDIRSWPSYYSHNDYRLKRPVENISYFDVRENPAGAGSKISPNWPSSTEPGGDSFVARLSNKAGGLLVFDLPTEAQWEWARRAGTTTALYDGTANLANEETDPKLDFLGRYVANGGRLVSGNSWTDPPTSSTLSNGTAEVGSYLPNAWGLYDMYGNVAEWCLDWFKNGLDGGEDPKGPSTGSDRVRRGGSWYNPASFERSAYRHKNNPITRNHTYGFRLAAYPVHTSQTYLID